MIHEGIDLAIRYDDYNYEDLHIINLWDETLIPVCSPMHKLPKRHESMENYFKKQNLLHDLPWDGVRTPSLWLKWLTQMGVKNIDTSKGEFFNLAYLATKMSMNGRGIALGSSLLVIEHLRSGLLTVPYRKFVESGASYKLLSLEKIEPDTPADTFKKWLVKEIEKSKIQINNYFGLSLK